MTDRLHLQPKHREALDALLREHLPDVEVWAYGSRVNGRSHDGSDLDLVLRGPGLKEIPVGNMADFEEAVRESCIPFLVDARDWSRLPEQFHREIEREHVVLEQSTSCSDWRVVAIDDIADIIGGGTPSTKNAKNFDGTIPWLTPKDLSGVHDRYIERGERNLSQQGLDDSSARIVPAGSVLLSTRAPIGYTALAKNPIATNQGFRALMMHDHAFPEYIYYWLRLNTEELERHASGSTFKELSGSSLKKIQIPLPPLPEQRAIAGILGALDDKIALNRRMNETLEAMARAIFRDWFVDFGPVRAKMAGRAPYLAPEIWELFPDALDEEGKPAGWVRLPLDKIANFLNGLALQKFPALGPDDSLPVIKIAELRAGITPRSSRASYDVPDKYVVRDGDFLFSWSGSLLAKFWTEGEGALNQHLFKVTSERFPSWFVSQWVLHHLEEFQAIAASKTTTMGHIQRRHLKEATTTCPSDGVLSLLGPSIGPLIEHTIKNKLESRKLAETRDLLLPKLMSGEIRLRDAEEAVEDVA